MKTLKAFTTYLCVLSFLDVLFLFLLFFFFFFSYASGIILVDGSYNWFQIGKGIYKGCILSLCLFNSYAENIMRNAGLDEAQAGIKIARTNINNFRYAVETTLWQSEEETLDESERGE